VAWLTCRAGHDARAYTRGRHSIPKLQLFSRSCLLLVVLLHGVYLATTLLQFAQPIATGQATHTGANDAAAAAAATANM
jgi:hypothetical protein